MAFDLISYHGNAHPDHNTMLFYVLLNDQNEEEMVAHSGNKSVQPSSRTSRNHLIGGVFRIINMCTYEAGFCNTTVAIYLTEI